MTGLSTLCYIEKDGKYLMLHRTVKKNDVNKDKWIGVGGHFEADESPVLEFLRREVHQHVFHAPAFEDGVEAEGELCRFTALRLVHFRK